MRLGEKSRLLVTTRLSTILNEIDAYQHELGLLTDEQARDLLIRTAEIEPNSLPPESQEIIEHCENLPLALAMIGAMVKKKPRTYWKDVLDSLQSADLEDITARFPEYPYPNLFAALQVSIDALDDELRENYYDFSIFPDAAVIPETVPVTYWQPMKPRIVRRKLDELVSRNLLRRTEDGSLSIHDLQLTYLRRQAVEPFARHTRLLNNYNSTRRDWHTLQDDGYLYDHLIYHLQAAKDYSAIQGLFKNQAWMYVRFERDNYTYTGYLQDLMIAWRNISHKTALAQIESGQEPTALANCIRYALIHGSINSLASNYLPELVVQALRLGLEGWSVERAFNIGRLIPSKQDRARFFAMILSSDEMEIDIQNRCLLAATEALEQIQ